MLHHDRNAGFNQAGEIRIAAHRRWIIQVIEAKVRRGRIAVGEKQGNARVRMIGGASGFVAFQGSPASDLNTIEQWQESEMFQRFRRQVWLAYSAACGLSANDFFMARFRRSLMASGLVMTSTTFPAPARGISGTASE